MSYLIYIAAAVVIGLLIGFVALSIGWLKKTVLRNIRSKTMGLLSVYDELLEQKSLEIQEAEAEKRRLEAAAMVPEETPIPEDEAPVAAYIPGDMGLGADYRDGNLGGVYRKIRQNFSYRVDELVPELTRKAVQGPGPAERLLQELSWDTVYRLSTLPAEEQIVVLRESLAPEAQQLVEDYNDSAQHFSALEFYDYLRSRAEAEPKPVRLRVSPERWERDEDYPGLEILADEQICEGFQVEAEHQLYDYCIKARELR